MRIHLIGLFHTVPAQKFSHCAFTNRVRVFGKMMIPYGYEIIEYSNEGSEAQSTEYVPILKSDEFENLKELYKIEQPNSVANVDSTLYRRFCEVLDAELEKRIQPGDIVAHPFGVAHAYLGAKFPEARHVEIGIGYTQCAFPLRIYETYQWWAWHQGKEQAAGNAYQWVVPMAYDTLEWDTYEDTGKYLLYFGRVIECKGLEIVKEIARHVDMEVRVVGEPDKDWFERFMADAPDNLVYMPPVTGKARSELLGNAYAMLMPTLYTEPFGGAGVEGMMCGTPLIAQDWGCFQENIRHGMNGFRCKTLGDWLRAIEKVKYLDREWISERTKLRYSLQNCGAHYDRIFKQISNLDDKGWYSLEPTDAIWE